MVLHWPQITYLVLVAVGLWIDVGRHGTARTGKYDARASIVAVALILWLLYVGGFFGGASA